MACFIRSTLLVLASISLAVNSLSSIPALLWSPERSMSHFPDVMGVDPIKTDDFLKGFLTPLLDSPSECGVVFVQDKLHMNDFTRFADVYSPHSEGGSFKNIRNLIDTHFSTELPQVANPFDAVEKLRASFSGDVHNVKSAEEVEGLDLTNDKKVLLIVHLNPVSGQKDLENAIQQNDATVGAIARHLTKRSIKYSALFTGKSASDDQAANVESHSNRRLLQDPSYNGTFLNVSDGQIYVFLQKAYLIVNMGGKLSEMNLTVNDKIAYGSTRNNKTAVIQYSFNNTKYNETTYNVKIEIEAVHLQDRWIMGRTALYIEGGVFPHNISLYNATLSPGDMDFIIPISYSWHCTDMKMYVDTINDKSLLPFKGTYIRLTGYQVQPFNIQKNRFFDAQDCVGYFTTAIWMFLFSSIFLVSILIFGVRMVLSLSTMDKYDDPKGKTITIAQATTD